MEANRCAHLAHLSPTKSRLPGTTTIEINEHSYYLLPFSLLTKDKPRAHASGTMYIFPRMREYNFTCVGMFVPYYGVVNYYWPPVT